MRKSKKITYRDNVGHGKKGCQASHDVSGEESILARIWMFRARKLEPLTNDAVCDNLIEAIHAPCNHGVDCRGDVVAVVADAIAECARSLSSYKTCDPQDVIVLIAKALKLKILFVAQMWKSCCQVGQGLEMELRGGSATLGGIAVLGRDD